MAFRARKVSGAFEKRAPGTEFLAVTSDSKSCLLFLYQKTHHCLLLSSFHSVLFKVRATDKQTNGNVLANLAPSEKILLAFLHQLIGRSILQRT